ncbi:MAG: hypothetical protein WBD51_04520 [Burkholderiaceae bacterium]
MNASAAIDDIRFRDDFESGRVMPADFHHRDHLRLAYVYLCESSLADAHGRMRSAIMKFLSANNVPSHKYHETLTKSWLKAVKHFLVCAGNISSFEQFLSADDRLLNIEIMLTHYSQTRLFSELARAQFVEPDLQAIPEYE